MYPPRLTSHAKRLPRITMTLLLLSAVGICADIQRKPPMLKAGSSKLGIHVFVVPILETPRPPRKPTTNDSISFNLQPQAEAQRLYEKRPIKASSSAHGDKGAVLETLTIVPE
jgi:hypothetical protein